MAAHSYLNLDFDQLALAYARYQLYRLIIKVNYAPTSCMATIVATATSTDDCCPAVIAAEG